MLSIKSEFLMSIFYLICLLSNFVATVSAADPSTQWPNGFTLQVYAFNNPERALKPIGWVTIEERFHDLVVGEQSTATRFHLENFLYFLAAGKRVYINHGTDKLLTLQGNTKTNWFQSDAQLDPKDLSKRVPIIQPIAGAIYGCDPGGTAKTNTKLLYLLDNDSHPCNVLIVFAVRPV